MSFNSKVWHFTDVETHVFSKLSFGGSILFIQKKYSDEFLQMEGKSPSSGMPKKKKIIDGDVFETDMLKALKEICLIPKRKDGRKLR